MRLGWIWLVTAALSLGAAATGWTQANPRGGRGADQPANLNRPPLPNGEAEERALQVLEELRQTQSRGMMNVPADDGRLLRLLAETTGAQRVVEIGTSNGYSGIWICLALRSTGGRLTTFEIDAGRAALARENFARAGVADLVTLVEGDAHQEIAAIEGPIDILFLDADKDGYQDYLDKLLPKLRPGGLILAHNTTNAGRDMQGYLTAVTENPALETLFLHQQYQGMGVTLKKR
jgi:predicted O-methyltransferase YrrM